MKLTDYFIRKKISILSKEAALRPHNYCSLDDAKKVLLLFQSEDEKWIDVCIRKLEEMHKKVQIVIYAKVHVNRQNDDSCLIVDANNDLNMFYYPGEVVMEHFNALQADMLIDLTHDNCYTMQYLLLQHTCHFKVGIQGRFPIYDMEFDTSKEVDISHIFDQMLFYLQIIRSK